MWLSKAIYDNPHLPEKTENDWRSKVECDTLSGFNKSQDAFLDHNRTENN